MILLDRFGEKIEFGDIPTWVTAFATAFTFLFALSTYLNNLIKSGSKESMNMYLKVLDEIPQILKNENKASSFYQIANIYDSISELEDQITEKEDLALVRAKLIITKRHIKEFFISLKVNDYFNYKKVDGYECGVLSFVPAIDVFVHYWDKNIKGKSHLNCVLPGEGDVFGSSPYTIEKDVLVKCISLFLCEAGKAKQTKDEIISFLSKMQVNSSNLKLINHLLDSESAVPFAFLFIKEKTIYNTNTKKLELMDCYYYQKCACNLKGTNATNNSEAINRLISQYEGYAKSNPHGISNESGVLFSYNHKGVSYIQKKPMCFS